MSEGTESSVHSPVGAAESRSTPSGPVTASAAAPLVETFRSAARSRSAWFVLLFVTIVALAADLVSKQLAFEHVAGVPVIVDREQVLHTMANSPKDLQLLIPRHEPVKVVPGLLHFTLVLNPGAVFGIGAGQRLFFIAFTGIAIVFAIFVFSRWTRPTDRAAHIGLALLIAGGLGNLYDRLFHGCVRDFIHPLPHAKYPWGIKLFGSDAVWPWVSNVADLFLIIGIGMLAIFLLRKDRAAHAASLGAEQTTK